jgi:hypothetical protein
MQELIQPDLSKMRCGRVSSQHGHDTVVMKKENK